MTTTPPADQLIATHVRKGTNPIDSDRLLNELATAHTGDNLAHALEYNGYVTAASAEHAVHALEIERVDNHVSEVAALLPFAVEVEAEMGGFACFQILLGTRTPRRRSRPRRHQPPRAARHLVAAQTSELLAS